MIRAPGAGTPLVLAAALAAAAAGAENGAAGSVAYRSPEGDFSIELPAAPTHRRLSNADGVLDVFEARAGEFACSVQRIAFRKGAHAGAPEEAERQARLAAELAGARVVAATRIRQDGRDGGEVVLAYPDGSLRVQRYFLLGTLRFDVAATDSAGTPGGAQRCLDSFRLHRAR